MSSTTVDRPLVCVVIPCLNREQYLVPTIESVLQQDYPRIECIVMDGGSTDATLDILRGYEGRIKWASKADQGPQDAINNGWRMSSGEILTWLNADDLWAPGAVDKAVAYLQQHADVDVVYGDCGIIDKNGKHISTARVPEWDLKHAIEYCDHTIHQAASFMRRSILERVGWLYPKLCHDHELWLRISLARGKLQRIPTLLAYARHHEGNLGYRADIVIPLKLDITRNFFTNPNLPGELHALRSRAVSNTYLRGIDYVFLGDFRWFRDIPRSLDLFYQAFRADSFNIFRILKYLLQFADGIIAVVLRRYLPSRLYDGLRAWKRRLARKLSGGYYVQEDRPQRT